MTVLSKLVLYDNTFFFFCHSRALMKMVNEKQDDWDKYLEPTLFSLRSKIQTTTKCSPFQLMYGREAVFPAEVPVEMPVSFFKLCCNSVLIYANFQWSCSDLKMHGLSISL